MLLYRVFPYLSTAKVSQAGHPLYEHTPQRGGRVDHPEYYVWYLARSPEAACGQAFGDLHTWDPSMFVVPFLEGGTRTLATYRLPNELRLLDLDDPKKLLERRLRPTQIVVRNLAVTQAWGYAAWSESDPHDANARRWDAISWWSYHHPGWPVVASWLRPELVELDKLSLEHPAVAEAAKTLRRVIP